MRHGAEDPRLRQQHDEDHRRQPEQDAELDEGTEPADADSIDADRDRIRHAEPVIRHDAGQHESNRNIERSADHERAEDADRHVALRPLRLLRRGRDRIEADIGEENHRRAADHARPAEYARTGIRRDQRAVGIARRHPVRQRDRGRRSGEKQCDHDKLHHDNES
ncbi:hypothetical protein chiPu_0033601, partial [Chiloscyllium punctatum]|nr:hypothetical protein [Chiloscyllium punctatum]